jgi:DNA polymerase-1
VGALTPCRTPAEYHARVTGPLTEVVCAMEREGCPVDVERLRALRSDFAARAGASERTLGDWAEKAAGWPLPDPVNWRSPRQLVLLLHSELGLHLPPSPFKKKGAVELADNPDDEDGEVCTDDRALEWLGGQHPEYRAALNGIRDLRKWERYRNYAEDWLVKGIAHQDGTYRLHPVFGLAHDGDDRPGAVTGRFAVKNPPLQQVPSRGEGGKLLRGAFVAPPGRRLIVADYAQLEVVILAHLCSRLFGTTGLRDRLTPGAPDVHSATAAYVFGEVLRYPQCRGAVLQDYKGALKWLRDLIKAIRYGLNYGKGPVGFGTTLFDAEGNPLGEKRAQQMIDALLDFDPEIRRYQGFIRQFIEAHRYIPSLLGRVLPLPGATAQRQGERNRAWRRALNYPMQAGGQEVTALAMIAAFRDPELRALGFRLSLQVHDELVGHAPEAHADRATARLAEIMCDALPLDAPLQVSAHHAERWSEAK